MNDINVAITSARQKRGISQSQLARTAGISQPALSAIESGDANPSAATVILLARAMNCTISELYGESEQSGPPALTDYEEQLLTQARQLNADGRRKLAEYARDLSENERYTKERSAKTAI